MQLTITGAFKRDLKKLSKSGADDVIVAIALFQVAPKNNKLNFEKVKSRNGYHSIRANFTVRVLLRELTRWSYEVVAVGNHDKIYARYFKS